jgi:Outer membrane protein beta-barrel domain
MRKQAVIGFAALAFCAAASAQLYGVVSVGTSRLDLDCGAASCDKSGTAFKLLGGYRFMPNLAGEFGYFDFGKAKASDGTTSLTVKTTAFGGGLAYHQDFARDWNFVARLGVATVKTKVSASVVGVGSGSDSDTNAQAYVGLGVGYKLNKDMSLDLAWDGTRTKYSSSGVSASDNVNAFSLGLTVGF